MRSLSENGRGSRLRSDTLNLCEFGLQWVPPPGLSGTRGHYQVPSDSRPSAFETCVNSAVVAERNGADWVMFGDVTDFYFPSSVWNGELSDEQGGRKHVH
jgi:hypothetical protein